MKDSHQKSLEFKFIKQLAFIGLKTCSSFSKLKHEILAPSFFLKMTTMNKPNCNPPHPPQNPCLLMMTDTHRDLGLIHTNALAMHG